MSSFNVNVFNELRAKYSTFESLKGFLESEQGGYIRVIDTLPMKNLCILRYDKQLSNFNLPHTKWFRSVVWDTEKNMPISVAPSKSSNEEDFNVNQDINEYVSSGVYCQEFIEGFMINCFKMTGDKGFYITSRSCFDATGNFYSDKSFRELFNDVITNSCDNTNNFLDKYNNDTNEEKGELSRFYSFIVYHPEHRIVSKVETPGYKEVHSGIVYSDGRVVIQDRLDIPKIQGLSENQDKKSIQEYIQEFLSEKDWEFQGLVFKDLSGNRWRFRNEKYQMVKSLRGNNPNPLTRFVQMFQQNITKKYLEFYPEEATYFEVYNLLLFTLTNTILSYYKSLHVYKTVIKEEIDKMYWPHLYNLHGQYLANLREKKQALSVIDVHLYLQKQPWQRVVFLMKKFMGEVGQ
jgi:hypothetical protein